MSKTLDEQLAELVMGWRENSGNYLCATAPTTEWTWKDDYHAFYYPKVWWQPTTDLNQLKMCYEAAEKDDEMFRAEFYTELAFLLVHADNSVLGLATAWVKHPELVAQAILKAKGVS